MPEQDPFGDLIPEPDLGEFADLVETPPLTKSEAALKNTRFFSHRLNRDVDPVGAGETMLGIGSALANETVKGIAGVGGLIAGMVPGGDSPNEKANKWLEKVPDFTYQPKTEGGATGMEMVGKGMEKVVDATKFVGSGYAGLGAMAAGADASEATQSMQDFRETPDAMAEGVFEHTQSPTMAVVAKLLPEIATLTAPVKKPPVRVPRPRMAPDMPEPGFGGIDIPETGPGGRVHTPDPQVPSPDAFDRIRQAVQNGDQESVLAELNANPALVAAFEELGIEFTPGMVSENAALRQLEGGLASKTDSGIKPAQELVEFKLNDKAQQLIDDAGGNVNSPSVLDDTIERRFNEVHSDYMRKEEIIWDRLDQQIPRGAEIDMQAVAGELEETAARLGKGDVDLGLTRMSKHEKELYNLTHRRARRLEDPNDPTSDVIEVWEYDPPPWEAVDRFRRRVGMGLDNRGPFNDAEMGALKHWYERTAEQQTRFARGNNYSADWDRMNQLTVERKALEGSMSHVFGTQLQKSAVAQVKTATNALLNGNNKVWDSLFESLPAATRQAAAAESLRTIFFTAGKGTDLSKSFVKNFEKLKRDPQIRDRVFDHLPMESRQTFMNIGEASTGFYRAMDEVSRSLTPNAQEAIKAVQNGGVVRRILRGFQDQTVGRAGPAGDWFERIFKNTPDQRNAASVARVEAGTNLLADPVLHKAIVEYAAGRIEAANEILMNSKSWPAWVKAQPIPAQERIMAAGIVALFDEESDE